MSKKKHEVSMSIGGQEVAGAVVDAILGISDENKRSFEITEAHIKDGFCNYVYLITKGVGLNESHNVKGAGTVKEEMENAFGKLHVHMAAIDGIFQHAGIFKDKKTSDINIDDFHIHELTDLYYVSGIKLFGSEGNEMVVLIGSEGNEMVVLIGSKRVAYVGDRSNFSTPRIPLDDLSSYPWHNELAEAIAAIKEEVSLYKEGNCVMPEQEEDEQEGHKKKSQKIRQRTIGDEIAERKAEEETAGGVEEEEPTGTDSAPGVDFNAARK